MAGTPGAQDPSSPFGQEPDWFLCFMMLAVAPTGLRTSTLKRLVSEWGRLRCWELANAKIDCKSDTVDISGLVEICSSLLIVGLDEEIEGLDDDTQHPFEVARPPILLGQGKEENLSIDFAFPEFRECVIRAAEDILDQNYSPRTFLIAERFIHKLLAEEAIRQQTIVLRHGQDVSGTSVRPFRRLLQAIFHGVLSLPGSDEVLDETFYLDDDTFTIPHAPADAWLWLRFFAYRRLLEAPPSWRMSRTFGADDLKLDLLNLFEKHIYPKALPKRDARSTMDFLLQHVSSETAAQLVEDHYISKAQAAYGLGDTDSCEVALKDLESRLGPINALHRPLRADERIRKKRIDLALLRDRPVDAGELARAGLSELGVPQELLLDYSGQMHPLLTRAFEEIPYLEDSGSLKSGIVREIKSLTAKTVDLWTAEDERRDQKSVIGLLFRLGESYAAEGDLLGREGERPSGWLDTFIKAYAIFRLAESMRLRMFSLDPTGTDFIASGHATRTMIRVALKIENARSEALREDLAVGFYGWQARRMADVLARHQFKHPRERASMLILEATIARLLSRRSNAFEALNAARNFLTRAEPVVLGLGPQARTRLRLYLERGKVHRHLFQVDPDERRGARYIELAQLDVDLLKSTSHNQQSVLWHRLAGQLQNSIKRAFRPVASN
jgi:hypothetical protein